jgi:hypothetical protein
VYPGLDFGREGSTATGGRKRARDEGSESEGRKMLMSIFEAPGVLEGKLRVRGVHMLAHSRLIDDGSIG